MMMENGSLKNQNNLNNERKIRYDLVPAHGIKEISKVLTSKLDTYEENQWKKG